MGSANAGNRRNAVFLLGHLLPLGSLSEPHLPAALRALAALLSASEPDAAVRDNAASAAIRLLLQPHAKLPEAELLSAVLDALPLKEDEEEIANVHGGLCTLLRRGTLSEQAGHRVLALFAQLAGEPAAAEAETPEEVSAMRGRQQALADIGGTTAWLLLRGKEEGERVGAAVQGLPGGAALLQLAQQHRQ
jgi:hypothetical protein